MDLMKILYITTISSTIGFLIPHIKFFIEQGHKIDIACNVVDEIDKELIKLGCEVHNIEFQRSPIKKENYLAYKHIRDLVAKGGYDAIHTHTPVASFIARIACRKIQNLKIIYTAHGFHFLKGAPLKSWLMYYPIENIGARFTDVIITMNEEDYINAKNMKLRPNGQVYKIHGVGIDLNKFNPCDEKTKLETRAKYGFTKEDFILFYPAELNHNKHQDLIIDAVNLVKEAIPNIKVLLAGKGPLEDFYKEQVEKLKLEDKVVFLGYRKDVPELLKMVDVSLSASRREGLPVNIMEAMAMGIPLVVTDTRGNVDLIANQRNGYIVKINDVGSFARYIEEIYRSPHLKEKFKMHNLEDAKKYDIENVKKELESIYAETFNL